MLAVMDIRVEFDAPLTDQADPTVVWFGERRLPVRSVVDRWYGTGVRWWKLETEDGLYILRRQEDNKLWELAAVPRA